MSRCQKDKHALKCRDEKCNKYGRCDKSQEHKEHKEHKEQQEHKEHKEHKQRFSFKNVLKRFNEFYSFSAMKMAFLGANSPSPNAPDGYLSLYALNYPCVTNEKTSYKSWCADANNIIYNLSVPNSSGITKYRLVSLLADSAPTAYTTLTANCCNQVEGDQCYSILTNNYRAINYILNETNRYVATLNPVNSEIQVAMWNLLHNEDLTDLQSYIFPDADLSIVRIIVDTSLAAQNKSNMSYGVNSGKGDKIIAGNKIVGLLGFPDRVKDDDGVEKCYQVILLPVKLSDFQNTYDKCQQSQQSQDCQECQECQECL